MKKRVALLLGASLALCAALCGCGGTHPPPADPNAAARAPETLARADSASAVGSKEEARDLFARAAKEANAAKLSGLEARASIGAGLGSIALGDAESARRYLTRAVVLEPQSAPAHVALGRFHAAIRRYKDAKAEFERAAALDTLSAEPWYWLGLAYSEAGEHKLAVETLTRALSRNPGHAPSQAALAQVADKRFVAAGLPEGYAAMGQRSSVTRGELGVLLAGELGVDPDRRAPGADRPSDTEEARGTWGERWLRSTLARGWLEPFPDGSYHLADPVTRASLALTIAEVERLWAAPASGNATTVRFRSGSTGAGRTESFPDLGPRHYLLRAASEAVRIGLPVRSDGRFDPWASASGAEIILALQGLGRELGVKPIGGEPDVSPMVK